MKKISTNPLWILITFCIFSPLIGISQVTSDLCATGDLSTAEYNAMMNNGVFGQIAGGPPSSSTTNWNLPLHIYFVTDENGNLPSFVSNTDQAIDMVDYINTRFTGNMYSFSFYICDITVLQNADQYFDFDYETEVDGLYGTAHEGEAINIYIVNSIIESGTLFRGFGRFPEEAINNFVVLRSEEVIGDSWVPSHELGHHFGLMHTHANQPGTPITLQNSGNLPDCETTGDNICDTNPDPYKRNERCQEGCSESECLWFFPPVPGVGTDYEFMPPKDNIMSYYNCTGQVFTDDQFEMMVKILLEHSNRQFLTDNIEATCVSSEIPKGRIEYDLMDKEPVQGLEINVLNNSQDCGIQISNNLGEFELNSCLQSNGVVEGSIKNPGNSNNNSVVQNYSNGVSTIDIVLGRRHILGIAPLDSPLKIIAGDVDQNGSFTTLDLIFIQRVILGIATNFPSDTPSWRFLSQYFLSDKYDFSAGFLLNPFDETNEVQGQAYPDYLDQLEINISPLAQGFNEPSTWSFYAIKMGDLNNNAKTNEDQSPLNEPSSTEVLVNGNNSFAFNQWQMIDVNFQIKKQTTNIDLSAYQLELQFDPQMVELSTIVPLSDGLHPISQDIYCLDKDNCIARLLWFTTDENYPFIGIYKKNLFGVRLLAKTNLSTNINNLVELNTSDFKAQFYDEDGLIQPIELSVDTRPVFSNILNAYPNPATNNMTLDIPISVNGSDVEVRLYQWNSSNNDTYNFQNLTEGIFSHTFDISSFNTGNYIARVCITPPGGNTDCDNDTLIKF